MRFRLALAAIVTFGVAQTAMAHTQIYTTSLSGPNEFPANASPGVGFSTLTVDLDLLTMRVEADFSGLTGNVTVAHIHGPIPDPPANPLAGVITPVPTFPGFPAGVTAGSYDQTFDLASASSYNPDFITMNGGTVGSAMTAFLVALEAGKTYLNIHSSTFPGGEVRGFYELIPEPSSLALAALAAVALPAVRRRQGSRS